VTEDGNFEGHNILNLGKSLAQHARLRGLNEAKFLDDMAAARAMLLEERNRRVHPGLDDKVLANWNGLAIDALAVAAGALNEPRFLEVAMRGAEFVWNKMRSPDGRLWHSWRQGVARGDAFLDDYAALARAFVTLYETSFEECWIERAVILAESMLAHFSDPQQGGFFFTADDHEQLIARQKQLADDAVPSGNALAAEALLRLGCLTGRQDFLEAAAGTLRAASALMRDIPQAAGQMLLALDFQLGPSYELVLEGDLGQPDVAKVLAAIWRHTLPPHVLASRQPGGAGDRSSVLDHLFQGRQSSGELTLHICQDSVCRAPVRGVEEALGAVLQLAGRP
jgi:uncharacterized protein YyaL (SSP411 family)